MRHRIGNTAVLAAGYHLAFAIGTGLAVAAIIVTAAGTTPMINSTYHRKRMASRPDCPSLRVRKR
jgi:hypothetical protein